MSVESEIIDLEKRRCASIGERKFDELRGILADDYLHVFGSGETLGKDGYVKAVTDSPRVPDRSNLVVRVYGDTAVLTGDLLNKISRPDGTVNVVDAFATQVAVKKGGTWQFVSCQLTPKRARQYT